MTVDAKTSATATDAATNIPDCPAKICFNPIRTPVELENQSDVIKVGWSNYFGEGEKGKWDISRKNNTRYVSFTLLSLQLLT